MPISLITADRLRINVNWLLKLRWAAVVGQLLTVLTVTFGLDAEMPLVPLMGIIVGTAVTNLLFSFWYLKLERSNGWNDWLRAGCMIVDGLMTLDVLLLGGLLYFSGGTLNPFSVFFLVNLALAAVVVETEWIWVIGGLVVLSFLGLSIWHEPLPILDDREKIGSFTGYVIVRQEGQFVAFAAATTAIAYFIARLTREIRDRDAVLESAREREARHEKLESLATLAAGAAHELATPLSTIAVVARELERHLESSGANNDCVADARLIRTELAQCRTILDRMAGRAGESVGEGMAHLSVPQLIEEMLSGLPYVERIEVRTECDPTTIMVLPRVAIGQALRGIVKNALDAGGRDGRVTISVRPSTGGVRVEVTDNGPGMSEEILRRAGEPFFTTKQPGEGTGLGLFLARAVIDRLGGTFEIRSEPGRGTTAEIVLPSKPARAEA